MDYNKIVAWALAASMSGLAGKFWNDLDIEIMNSKQKSEAVAQYAELWETEKEK